MVKEHQDELSTIPFPLLFPFLGAQLHDLGPALALIADVARQALRQLCGKNAQLNLQLWFSQAWAGVSLCSLKENKKRNTALLCLDTTWSNFETLLSIHVTAGHRQTEKSSQFLGHWVNEKGWICLLLWIFHVAEVSKALGNAFCNPTPLAQQAQSKSVAKEMAASRKTGPCLLSNCLEMAYITLRCKTGQPALPLPTNKAHPLNWDPFGSVAK